MNKFNINDMATVELTPYGVDILGNHYEKYWQRDMETISGFNNTSCIYTTELWNLMQIFGECLYMGNPAIPFVSNEITIEHHE